MFKFDLLENEKILAVYRQSETVLFKPALWIMALIYFPWFFLIKYELAENYSRLLLFWTFLVLLYAINSYLLWLINVYLVTDRRLIQVYYKNLFNKTVLETPIARILNVSFHQQGILHSLFSVGSVEAQGAGLSEPILLKNVSQPSHVKDFLWKVHSHYGHEHPKEPRIIDEVEPVPTKTLKLRRTKRIDL